jgi:signal transduction histidine kinase
MCHRIVSALGGTITVERAPIGKVVTILLPEAATPGVAAAS